ncbi:MAG: bifunctional diaminohydroxyphosphoribosylaminopyrimidine deaminase/5-amino-6-(5-phosphoribosylamino)uracil reductase RibD [Phycisphaerales bacterium]
MLDLAARLGFRGIGHVEPNPPVGCVIVRPGTSPAHERIIGMGHHRRAGGVHAEVDALADCRARGHDPAGATVYVTLEPCNAPGRQPACVDALLAARVARVVFARTDPHAPKSGGAARLRAAGVRAELSAASPAARALAQPFARRIATGLPWVIVKWAQTIDGRIATRTGESRWISSERSRRLVHLTRARVDAVLTGIGTAKADDPRLTARDVPLRRRALRALIDPAGELSHSSRLARDTGAPELVQFVSESGTHVPAAPGATAVRIADGLDKGIAAALRWLHDARGVSTVLCECGPGITSRLITLGLADELHVYIAPMLMGDLEARPAVRGFEPAPLARVPQWRQVYSRSIGDDRLIVYRRGESSPEC